MTATPPPTPPSAGVGAAGQPELGEAIFAKRNREGLSLRQAGEVCGVAFSTLGRIENGGEPSLKVDRLIRAWLSGATAIVPLPPMTLRDWFAGQAIAGGLVQHHGYPLQTVDVAHSAYAVADAMLLARGQ